MHASMYVHMNTRVFIYVRAYACIPLDVWQMYAYLHISVSTHICTDYEQCLWLKQTQTVGAMNATRICQGMLQPGSSSKLYCCVVALIKFNKEVTTVQISYIQKCTAHFCVASSRTRYYIKGGLKDYDQTYLKRSTSSPPSNETERLLYAKSPFCANR